MKKGLNTNRLSILIVDDEQNIRKTLAICLEASGHEVMSVSNAKDALTESEHRVFDLAFVDLRLGTDNGMDLVVDLIETCPWIKIIVITAYAAIETAVEAMRRGAADYLPKPFTPEQVEIAIHRTAKLRVMERRISELNHDLHRHHPEMTFASNHPGMMKALEIARQVAPSEATVMLRGPSGTGKTALARAIHEWSERSGKPLGIVSCPSLSPELLESELFGHVKGAFTGALRDNPGRVSTCEGGTLFLDEIGDLPLSIQPKLLRFIQEREYERLGDHVTRRADVRIITATNADLATAVREKRFREDLFYRLNVIQLDLPPLSERPGDMERLALEMLLFFGSQNHKSLNGFSPDAMKALRNYSWPGNIRELRNVIERAVLLSRSPDIGIGDLPESIQPRDPDIHIGSPVSLARIEEHHIRRILAATKSLQDAADILEIDQATLWRKRKQYGI